LDEGEVKAVLAHEMGHIVHRDFIVMSIANTIIQLLYEIYYVLSRRRKNDKNGGALALIGLVSYIFYWIGVYIVLYLNRLREYYADEYSAETTGQPDDLSDALVKIAYGIMAKEDDASSQRLLESTKTMGIMSLQAARNAGLAAKVSNMEPYKVARVMLFDVVSPWAKLAELGSTHPLTGKRILKMEKMSAASGKPLRFNMEGARHAAALDKGKLWRGFFLGVFVYFIPVIAIISSLVAAILLSGKGTSTVTTAGMVAFVIILAVFLLKLFYRYPSFKNTAPTTVLDLMSNLYASPVRGRPAQLSGSVIGRGTPGYIFSEDMMMQDSTGLMYLDYQGAIPLFSRLRFALKKIKEFMGQPVIAKGWFFRSNTQGLVLKSVESNGKKVKGYPRLWSLIGAVFMAAILSGLIILLAAADQTSIKNLTTNRSYRTSLDTPCYSATLPSETTIEASSTCKVKLTRTKVSNYGGGTLAEFTYLDLSLQPASTGFDSTVAAWKTSYSSYILSETPTTVGGLRAEKFIYSFAGKEVSPVNEEIKIFVDTTSQLRNSALNTPYSLILELSSINGNLDQVLQTLQIKTNNNLLL
jgi:hypothetical protein